MNIGEFYEHDQRLGSVTTFNGVDIYAKYNADVYSFTPSAGPIDGTFQRKVSKSTFENFYFDFANGTLQIDAYVGGANKLDAIMNVNGLIAAASETTIYYAEDIGFYFDAILTSYSVTETGVEWFFDVSMTFDAIRHMPIVSETFAGSSFKFENLGSIPSGIKLTFVPSATISNPTLTFNDNTPFEQKVTFTRLTASYTFVIDGIDGHVTQNGINSILLTDLVKFPKAIPGWNTVNASFTADWTVEFYPTFEI